MVLFTKLSKQYYTFFIPKYAGKMSVTDSLYTKVCPNKQEKERWKNNEDKKNE